MKVDGNFAVDGGFSDLVAGQPDALRGNYAGVDLRKHGRKVVLDSCYRERYRWRRRWSGHRHSSLKGVTDVHASALLAKAGTRDRTHDTA